MTLQRLPVGWRVSSYEVMSACLTLASGTQAGEMTPCLSPQGFRKHHGFPPSFQECLPQPLCECVPHSTHIEAQGKLQVLVLTIAHTRLTGQQASFLRFCCLCLPSLHRRAGIADVPCRLQLYVGSGTLLWGSYT